MRTSGPQTAALAVPLIVVAALAGCGGGGSSKPSTTAAPTTTAAAVATTAAAATTSAQTAAANPCSLLTAADVAKLEPGLGHGKLQTIAGTQICNWPDAQGIPAVQLEVTTAPGTSMKQELANLNVGNNAYTIVSVAGLGDEAAAAFQKADASKGLRAGMATLAARSGGRVVSLSTPYVQILQGSSRFAVAKKLVATAISRLPGG